MLYPSGLLQRPLRFSVRRAVVPLSIWRPGQYIVLDTGGWGAGWDRLVGTFRLL